MALVSSARHQFPPAIIRHAVWLYLGFSLSYRDVEDLLAERGVDVSYKTVRRLILKFGVLFAPEPRKRRTCTSAQWHLDELVVVIGGNRFFLWRADDSEGGVLDVLLQRRRGKAAAVTFLRNLLRLGGAIGAQRVRRHHVWRATLLLRIHLSARHETQMRQAMLVTTR